MKFRHYLINRKFCLLTDNWWVVCLTVNFKLSRRFIGMLMVLVEFDFTVKHKAGKQNFVADMVSRLACVTVESMVTLRQLQQEDEKCPALHERLLSGDEANQDFLVIDEILYRRTHPNLNTIVVSHKLCQSVLVLTDDNNGHMGAKPTLKKRQDRYWWLRMT